MHSLTNYFFQNVPGVYPEQEDDIHIRTTNATINYLKDCGYSGKQIRDLIDSIPDSLDQLRPENLPDKLWEGSLLRRDTFYSHRILQILPPPPIRRKDGTRYIPDYFLEIKIRFTMHDLIQYFYKSLWLEEELIDEKRDAGSFEYLLKKYRKIEYCEPLDFVIELIDLASREKRITQVIELSQYEKEALGNMRAWKLEARLLRADEIHWRKPLCQ